MNDRLQLDSILFDLDGTLVDTAPGLAAALNRLRQIKGRPALDYEQIRPLVSHGGAALVALAFTDADAAGRELLRAEFLDLYARRLRDEPQESALFPGMAALLDEIEQSGRRWGIVTNKPTWLSKPLLATMQLDQRYGCLVCGDEVSNPKPDPEALLLACERLDCIPRQTLYIGDARRDIDAGRAAGMTTIAAGYGYLLATESPADWGADAIAGNVAAIASWLKEHARL